MSTQFWICPEHGVRLRAYRSNGEGQEFVHEDGTTHGDLTERLPDIGKGQAGHVLRPGDEVVIRSYQDRRRPEGGIAHNVLCASAVGQLVHENGRWFLDWKRPCTEDEMTDEERKVLGL